LTNAMMDTRNTEQVNWTRCSAAKAGHMLCIPEANATTLSSCEDGAFVEALVKMVLDGSESFSAACALCYLVGHTKESARDWLTRPSLLDTLAKTALTNPNATLAAEAVFKLLPVASYDLFRRIVLLLTLKSDFCLSTAISGILERANVNKAARNVMAEDECILMILTKAMIMDDSLHVKAQAAKAIHLLSIDVAHRETMLDDYDVVGALTKVIQQANLGSSSEQSIFHEASADATCTICNLVVDDVSNADIYSALKTRKKKHRKLCLCRWRKKAWMKLGMIKEVCW